MHDGEPNFAMVHFADKCRAISLSGEMDSKVPLGPPGEVLEQQEKSVRQRSSARDKTQRTCRLMDDYQLQVLHDQWGTHGLAAQWTPLHIQPLGPVHPVPVIVKQEKKKKDSLPSHRADRTVTLAKSMRSSAGAHSAPCPGDDREATLVIVEMLVLDNIDIVSSSTESGPVLKAVFPCCATMLHNSIANCVNVANGLDNLFLFDACGNQLPTHIRGCDHEYILVMDARYHAETFDSLARIASKSSVKQLEVGYLAVIDSKGVTHIDNDLPLYIAPANDSRVPKQWRLIAQFYYRLPNHCMTVPTDSDSDNGRPPPIPQQCSPINTSINTLPIPPKRSCVPAQGTSSSNNEPSAKRSRASNPSHSTSLTTLLEVRSMQRLRHDASSAPHTPPRGRALQPRERLLVFVFYEAAANAKRMVDEVRRLTQDMDATHPFVSGLPTLSLADNDKAGPIPLFLTDFGRFNGSMTLTTDAQIDWFFRHRLGGALESSPTHTLGRPDVLALQTCFWRFLHGSGPNSLTRWTKKVDWAVVRKILIPIAEPGHWSLTVIRNFSFDFDPDGSMNLRGKFLHFDSLRGPPNPIYVKIKQWLLHVLPLQARPQQPQESIKARDKFSSRTRQPKTDPVQRGSMNCGIFVITTALAECGLLPLAHVSEQYMTHLRQTLALEVLRDPACSLTRKGLPRPALCMAAFQGAHVVDTYSSHSNCVPSALLAVLAAHSSAHALESLALEQLTSSEAMDAWLRTRTRLDSRVQELVSPNLSTVGVVGKALQSAREAIATLHGDPRLAADGVPIPLRALHHALHLVRARAILLVCSPDQVGVDAAYYIGSADVRDSEVTSVLLYSHVGQHVVPLLWPQPGLALAFALIAVEVLGSSSFDTLQSILECDASATWSACGTVVKIPDWCKSLSGDADSDGLAQGVLVSLLILLS